jgi:transcriptional regulator with XRE-family HTH domain
MEFRERLRHLRERRGWNQNELAKRSGVAQAVIHRLEAGVRGVDHLSVGVARRLARALGVSVDHLIGMYDEDSRSAAKALVPA